MTRINCIDPHRLTNRHLLAEYREMLRLRHLHPRARMPHAPCYRLGQGHVLFFADKGDWLLTRHEQIRHEMAARGYRAQYHLDLSSWPATAMNGWQPDVDDKLLNVGRIINRLK